MPFAVPASAVCMSGMHRRVLDIFLLLAATEIIHDARIVGSSGDGWVGFWATRVVVS